MYSEVAGLDLLGYLYLGMLKQKLVSTSDLIDIHDRVLPMDGT